MKNGRKIVFGIIIIICIIAVNIAVYLQFFKNTENKTEDIQMPVIEEAKIIKDFNQLFNNKVDYQGISLSGLKDPTKDIVYSNYTNTDKKEDSYELNVNIPVINVNSEIVENINKQIESIFKTKATSILVNVGEKTIYSVEYTAYLNSNILSLVIKSNLKEGTNPQRVIVKTYNYNLSTNEEITLAELLEIKNLSSKAVSDEIQVKVNESNEQAKRLKELGYNVYIRDLTNDMYKIERTNNFFLGVNGALYIVYPYGNSNNTSEMDVILIE